MRHTEDRLVRVGEGHYTTLRHVPPEVQAAVKQVLEDMRQVTMCLKINGSTSIPLRGISKEQQDARTPTPSRDRSKHRLSRVAARRV